MNELTKRTVFGLLFVIVVIGSILLHEVAFVAVMLATLIIGSMEVGKLMTKDGQHSHKLPLHAIKCFQSPRLQTIVRKPFF